MQNQPLISILLPVYNSEIFLRNCLNALICQSYKNIEVIAVNDGSTDNSLQILQEYAQKDSRVKVFSQDNRGAATTRNHCMSKASGEYIMFCDSDDIYEPDMCEKMLATLLEKDVDVVMCLAKLMHYNNYNRYTSENHFDKIAPYGFIDMERYLSKYEVVYLWNKIFKKSLIDKYNIRFPDGLEADDALFCYQYLLVCKKGFGLSNKLYNYNVRENSVMDLYHKRKSNNFCDRIKIMLPFYCFLTENKLFEKYKYIYLSKFLLQFRILWNLARSEAEKGEILECCKAVISSVAFDLKKYSFFRLINDSQIKKIDEIIKSESIRFIILRDFSFISMVKQLNKLLFCYFRFLA